MVNRANPNPVLRLLKRMPWRLVRAKRAAIRADLEAIGKYEHLRQCVLRADWNMGDTHIACAEILMKHLELPMSFFTGTDEQRQQQLEESIRRVYASQVTNNFLTSIP